MRQVKRARQAQRDLCSIAAYIAVRNPSAAERWFHEMVSLLDMLAAHPEAGERIETRRFGVARRHSHGNYVVYYRPRQYGVFVLRVLHGAQDPGRRT